MKHVLGAAIIAGSFAFVALGFAQSGSTPAVVPVPQASSAAASPPPAGDGKKVACQTASQAAQGQDRKDQMQLCMMQARMDCLKQAIDQKIVGPQRKDFMKTCAG